MEVAGLLATSKVAA